VSLDEVIDQMREDIYGKDWLEIFKKEGKRRLKMWNYSKGRNPVRKEGSMESVSEIKRNGKVVEGLPGAWQLWQEGDILEQGDKKLKLIHKQRRFFELCPKCGSTMTFHSVRESGKKLSKKKFDFGNCCSHRLQADDVSFLAKSDICMSCGYRWVFEMFTWEIIDD